MEMVTCDICRATVPSDGTMYGLCSNCHFDRIHEKENFDSFIRHEFPKFQAAMAAMENGELTVTEFYSILGELVEPF